MPSTSDTGSTQPGIQPESLGVTACMFWLAAHATWFVVGQTSLAWPPFLWLFLVLGTLASYYLAVGLIRWHRGHALPDEAVKVGVAGALLWAMVFAGLWLETNAERRCPPTRLMGLHQYSD